MGRYQQEFRRSLADPHQFWRDAAGKPVPSTIEDPAALDALRPLPHEG
jgi:hypothetical protein